MKNISKIAFSLLLLFVGSFAYAQQNPVKRCGVGSNYSDTVILKQLPWFGNNAWLKSYTDSIVRARSLLYLPPPPRAWSEW